MTTPGGNPPLSAYEEKLGLPSGFASRARHVGSSDRVDEVLSLRATNKRRVFLLGVLIAYIAVAEELLSRDGVDSLPEIFDHHPPLEYQGGRRLNTLTLGEPSVSLRTYYNYVEGVILGDLLRLGYPNSAPHATQSWSQHRREFELICEMTPAERASLADALWADVLAFEEQKSRAGEQRLIRPFEDIVRHFPNTQSGEPGGSVLQGLAYAYYRADSPNVTLRIYKVGSGSARVGATGDVDGWIGDSLELSVEVKDMPIRMEDIHQFDMFVKHLNRWPNCTAVALAREFTPEVIDWLSDRNILAFDRGSMESNVAYWDLPKQRLAVQEFLYYLAVVQRNPKLLNRFKAYCVENGIDLGHSFTLSEANDGNAETAIDT